MSNIKLLLWDIDGTVLDFKISEKLAITRCFSEFGLGECSSKMASRYSEINLSWWEKLEKGLCSKKDVTLCRFEDWFKELGIDTSIVSKFNNHYRTLLQDYVFPHPNAIETMAKLSGKVIQCIATNGGAETQTVKIQKSGMTPYISKAYISDIIGYEKPSKEFFNSVFSDFSMLSKDQIMIVGDSLTSDMQGGNNAGIVCCWYNPEKKFLNKNVKIDYEITDLAQVADIVL